jgi:hypothetical protein
MESDQQRPNRRADEQGGDISWFKRLPKPMYPAAALMMRMCPRAQ